MSTLLLLLSATGCLYISNAEYVDAIDRDDDGWASHEIAGGRDCDDTDADVYPGAPELCGGVDEDCDGQLSDDEIDQDGDGVSLCDGDCDDADPTISPGLPELCDPDDLDEDCDGLADDDDPDVSNALAWFEDTDGDNFGILGTPGVSWCDPPDGWVALGSDCDDSDPAINPAASEVCDPDDVDENCNNLADDEDWFAEGGVEAWPDVDGDGWGDDDATPVALCELPADWVLRGGDCDDSTSLAHPDQPVEICEDGLDNRCDGPDEECAVE